MHKYRYFLSANIAGETIEREVTLEEFCKAERAAGFRPKLWSGDPAYMTTPATGGFSNRNGISGRTEYVPNALAQGRAACGESLGAGGSAANDKEKANA